MSFINSGSIVVTSFNGILFCRYDAKIRQALKPSAQGPKSPPRSPPLPNQQFGVPLAVYVASAPSILFNYIRFVQHLLQWCCLMVLYRQHGAPKSNGQEKLPHVNWSSPIDIFFSLHEPPSQSTESKCHCELFMVFILI